MSICVYQRRQLPGINIVDGHSNLALGYYPLHPCGLCRLSYVSGDADIHGRGRLGVGMEGRKGMTATEVRV